MSKKLFFVIACVFQLNYAMKNDTVSLRKDQFPANFSNLCFEGYNKPLDYDLKLKLWRDDRSDVTHGCPSLLAHGFGASSTTMIEYARVNGSYRIPGDAVTFNFKDAFVNSGLFILHTSFGQINDIKSFLVALRAMYDCKVNGCNLFGQSRGGGTIPNALAILNTSTDHWDKGFDSIKFFFKEEDRLAMIAMVKKGVVVLDTPMVTSHGGINAHVNKVFRGLFFVEKIAFLLMNYIVLPLVTCGNYSPYGPQALSSISKLPKDLKVLVSYQKNDSSVGNLQDKEFALALRQHLLVKNVWILLGNDERKEFDDQKWRELIDANDAGYIHKRFGFMGLPYRKVPAHNAGFFLLFQSGVLNELFKKNGGSYLDHTQNSERAIQILSRSQPELLDDFFIPDNYDANNEKINETVMPVHDKIYNGASFARLYITGLIAILFNFLMYIQ